MDIKIPKKWFQPSKWFEVKKKVKKFRKGLIKSSGSMIVNDGLEAPFHNLTNLITGVVVLGVTMMVGSTILGTLKDTLTDPAYNATNEVTQSLLSSMSIFTPMFVIMIMLGTGVMLWIQRASVPMFFFVEFGVSMFLTILGVSPGLVFMTSVLMCAFYAWWYFQFDDDI